MRRCHAHPTLRASVRHVKPAERGTLGDAAAPKRHIHSGKYRKQHRYIAAGAEEGRPRASLDGVVIACSKQFADPPRPRTLSATLDLSRSPLLGRIRIPAPISPFRVKLG